MANVRQMMGVVVTGCILTVSVTAGDALTVPLSLVAVDLLLTLVLPAEVCMFSFVKIQYQMVSLNHLYTKNRSGPFVVTLVLRFSQSLWNHL